MYSLVNHLPNYIQEELAAVRFDRYNDKLQTYTSERGNTILREILYSLGVTYIDYPHAHAGLAFFGKFLYDTFPLLASSNGVGQIMAEGLAIEQCASMGAFLSGSEAAFAGKYLTTPNTLISGNLDAEHGGVDGALDGYKQDLASGNYEVPVAVADESAADIGADLIEGLIQAIFAEMLGEKRGNTPEIPENTLENAPEIPQSPELDEYGYDKNAPGYSTDPEDCNCYFCREERDRQSRVQKDQYGDDTTLPGYEYGCCNCVTCRGERVRQDNPPGLFS